MQSLALSYLQYPMQGGALQGRRLGLGNSAVAFETSTTINECHFFFPGGAFFFLRWPRWFGR